MSADLLEAIQAERRALIEPLLAPIADKLRTLEEMEHLARSLNGGGSDVPAVKAASPPSGPKRAAAPKQRALPARTPATRRGRDGLGRAAQEVLEAMRAAGGQWMSVREIAGVADSTTGALKHHFKALLARDLIEAKGQTTTRRYRAKTDDNGSSGGSESLALPPAPRPASPVPSAGPRSSTGSKLSVADRRVCRARILDHCSRRRLDEQSLATTLGIDREEVADLCGELLLDDKIVLLPDGRYEVPE